MKEMSDNLPRLRPGSPHKSNLDDRFLSFVPGAVSSLVMVCCIALSDGTERSPFVWLGVVLFGTTIFGASTIIRQFKPDFKERGVWIAIGVAVGLVVFVPLIITPKCGFWGDKCKTAQHPVIRHAR
jgi:hypothetical protein